jgi:NADPH-dependent ferric siderophore reductase
MAKPSTYRLFHVEVKARHDLSPSLARFVFGAPDVAGMACPGPDQRIKVFFPLPGQIAPAPPEGPDWYAHYRAMAPTQRPPMRTYTISALRAAQAEVDVDFVLHGDSGPASSWAVHAKVGDRVALLAPRQQPDDETGGYEWKPPTGVRRVLIVADETALPAAVGILRTLAAMPAPPQVDCLIEVPLQGDADALGALDFAAPADARVQWLPREGRAHGECLMVSVAALFVQDAPAASQDAGADQEQCPEQEQDPQDDMPWETATSAGDAFYAWIAGESSTVMALRRHLVQQAGIDKGQITFMGYWRIGRALE